MARLLPVAVVISAVMFPALPLARADDESVRLLSQGVALREQGRDAEALDAFERARAIDPSAQAQAQVALAEQALGRWIDAEQGLVLALRADEDPWIARNRGALDQALATVRAHLAWLDLEVDTAGAEIWLDGKRVGTAPLSEPLRVVAGAFEIDVRHPDYPRVLRRLDVSEGVTLHQTVSLAPPRAPAPTSVPRPLVALRAPSAPESSSPPSRTAAWVTLAASGALATAAVIAHLVRENDVAIYDDDTRCLAPGKTRDEICGSYRDGANAATVLAIMGYSAAGLAAVASVYLFTRSAASRPAGSLASLGVARCAIGPTAFSCGVDF